MRRAGAIETKARWLLTAACVAAGGCSPYTGSAKLLESSTVNEAGGWLAVKDVPLMRQQGEHDCGATALAMVIRHLRPELAGAEVLARHDEQPVSARELRDRARSLGLSAFVVQGTPQDLVHELQQGRPAIVGVAKPTVRGAVAHYQVVIGLHAASQRIALLDPAEGWLQNTFTGFLREWQATGRVLIVVLPQSPLAMRRSHTRLWHARCTMKSAT